MNTGPRASPSPWAPTASIVNSENSARTGTFTKNSPEPISLSDVQESAAIMSTRDKPVPLEGISEMKAKSTLTRAVLATAAAATALVAVAPTVAAAQSYGYSNGYSQGGYAYDGCRREQTSRGTLGALAGAAAGIALGNNASRDRSSRRNAAAAGGVLGAVIGSQIGKNSAACTPGYETSYDNGYYDRGYNDRSYAPAPSYGYYEQRPSYYDRDYYDRYQQRYAQGGSYGYDYAPPSNYETTSRCTYVESPIYMPDGRTEKRMVQVCPDRNGRYQVVQ
jgi:hypothetical protein